MPGCGQSARLPASPSLCRSFCDREKKSECPITSCGSCSSCSPSRHPPRRWPRAARAPSPASSKTRPARVLPGVTVEASSPALIEKVAHGRHQRSRPVPRRRSAAGHLHGHLHADRASPPSCAKASCSKSNFMAPINVEMAVGTVEQNVTVTGESPVVDVQTSQRREVVSQRAARGDPDRPQLRADGQHGAGGQHRAVRRRRLDAMWVGGSLTRPRLAERRFADAHRRDGGRRDVRAAASAPASTTTKRRRRKWPCRSAAAAPRTSCRACSSTAFRAPAATSSAAKSSTNFCQRRACRARTSTRTSRRAGLPRRRSCTAVRHQLQRRRADHQGPAVVLRLGPQLGLQQLRRPAPFNQDGTQAIDDNNLKAFPARLTGQVDARRTASRRCSTGRTRFAATANLSRTITSGREPFEQSQPAQHIAQAKWTSTLTNHLLFETGYNQTFNNAALHVSSPRWSLGTCHTAFNLCAPGTGYGSIPHQDLMLGTQHRRDGRPAPASRPAPQQHADDESTCTCRRCRT